MEILRDQLREYQVKYAKQINLVVKEVPKVFVKENVVEVPVHLDKGLIDE